MEEELIRRARILLSYMSEQDAIAHLVNGGIPPSHAYLAVMAAAVLTREEENAGSVS